MVILMSDKKDTKQIDLELGKVEYITDPDFVPERYVDAIGIDNLKPENYFELIDEILEIDPNYDHPYTGRLDGEDFIIVDTWDQLADLTARLNGWTGGEITNVFGSVEEERQRLNENLKAGHYKLGIENSIKKLDNLVAYRAWIEFNEFEEVSLEDFNIETGFSDEYSLCSCGNCSNVVRTSPDCYQWMPPLDLGDGYISEDCASEGDYDEEILDYYANEAKSIPEVRTPDELGLVKVNTDTYQNGLHHGMDDSPEPIIRKFQAAGVDMWFKVYSSQFNVDFDVYVRTEDKDRAIAILEGTDTYQGYSTAGNCEKALRSARMSSDNTEGIKVNSIDVSTGTCTTKTVSKQDFIEGKALDK